VHHFQQSVSPFSQELAVRQFLLTNLKEAPDKTLKFRVNLEALSEAILKTINAFPLYDSQARFENPSLFIKGSKSNYVSKGSEPDIQRLFPKSEIISLNAGHW
jgi:hypothetical protein